MVDVTIRKRYRNSGIVYEYRFEIASVDGKRQWQTKSGFKTVAEVVRRDEQLCSLMKISAV